MNTFVLSNKRGFKWYSNDLCYVKGYLYDGSGKYYDKEELLSYFKGIESIGELNAKAKTANGSFLVILELGQTLLIASDIIRSLPVFYMKTETGWIISDEANEIVKNIQAPQINVIGQKEYLGTGYVTGSETLVEGISQLQAGEVVELKDGVRKEFYSTYRVGKAAEGSYESFKSKGIGVIEKTFERLLASLNGKTAVIPLSGGYDSRLIAVMMKKAGYENVVCFTYGRKGNPEALISKRVADRLNYSWYFIEYTEELIADYVSSKEFRKYYPWASNLSSMFFMQEYFAVQYLKKQKLIPSDSVFIPGHSGDFLGGSQFAKHNISASDELMETLAGRILRVKYHYAPYSKQETKILKERILKRIEEKSVDDTALSYSIYEDYDFKEKLAKFNVNSCSTYTFFDYEFRLPYYDMELVNFFSSVPVPFKLNKLLYDDILVNSYFKEYGLNFESELQADEKVYARSRVKQRIKKVLPAKIINLFVEKKDLLCYLEITSLFRNDLIYKGKQPKFRGNKYNKMIIEWFLEDLKDDLKGNI